VDGLFHERETPHPSELGGEKGDGADVSTVTSGDQLDFTPVIGEYRVCRFAIQRAVALTCRADALANFPHRYPSDVYRVIGCMWCRAGQVQVVRSIEFNRAYYKGL
jgi:hypothetical protein